MNIFAVCGTMRRRLSVGSWELHGTLGMSPGVPFYITWSTLLLPMRLVCVSPPPYRLARYEMRAGKRVWIICERHGHGTRMACRRV